jgi:hypothetical protein
VNRPTWLTLLRDVALFLVGVALVLKQAGIGFPAPEGGPQIELIIVGGLFCNGPLMLQFLALRFGSGGSGSQPQSPVPPSQPLPSSAQSTGGE